MLAGVDPGFCDPVKRRLQSNYSLGTRKPQSSPRLRRPSLRTVSPELVRGGLTPRKLEGAASRIPSSQLGFLFFGIAQELEKQEGETTVTALGYYMAALTDPHGSHFADAKRRIEQVVLRSGVSHEEAVRLYDGGLGRFKDLSRSGVGITKDGVGEALVALSDIKAAYHAKRRRESGSEGKAP